MEELRVSCPSHIMDPTARKLFFIYFKNKKLIWEYLYFPLDGTHCVLEDTRVESSLSILTHASSKYNKTKNLDIVINSDFIEDWVKIALPAKNKVLGENGAVPFGDQCTACEKVK